MIFFWHRLIWGIGNQQWNDLRMRWMYGTMARKLERKCCLSPVFHVRIAVMNSMKHRFDLVNKPILLARLYRFFSIMQRLWGMPSANMYAFICIYRICVTLTGCLYQAWYLTEATEAIASVAPGLCLSALSKVPIEIYKFLIEVPFAKENRLAPSSTKYQACYTHDENRKIHLCNGV